MKLAVLKKRAGRSWVNLREVFLPLSEVNFFFFFAGVISMDEK